MERKLDAFDRDVSKYQRCIESGRFAVANLTTGPACIPPREPSFPSGASDWVVLGGPGGGGLAAPAAQNAQAVQVSPEQVAYMALARLRLDAPTPEIGPSPDVNRWKMAVVGYPLWLWADGTLDPAPVRDSVYNLAVSLDARVVETEFDMDDGHTVTCTEVGTRWTSDVKAGQESPSCGYRYQQPSLPEGPYTVTARTSWAIDWSINGQTGTIPYVQSASTELPVGELQVLVR